MPSFIKQLNIAPNTEVAKALSSINADSSFYEYRFLATLSKDEYERLKYLRGLLAQEPRKIAQQLRLRQNRINKFLQFLENISSRLSNESIETLKGIFIDTKAKSKAAEIAATKLFSGEPLSNIGGDAWKELWEAARRYSDKDAYPGFKFPFLEENAVCVLCQQILGPEAKIRMEGFEEFIKTDTKRTAEESKRELDQNLDYLKSLQLFTINHREILHEIAIEDNELINLLRRFIIFCKLRIRSILRFCKKGVWLELPDLPPIPSLKISIILRNLEGQAKEMDRAEKSDERNLLIKELQELEAHQSLFSILDDIRKEIERMNLLKRLRQCIKNTDTAAITRKSSELADEFVSESLISKFISELSSLGPGFLRAELISAGGEYGSKRFKINLPGMVKKVKVSNIVSEGEFKCLALAGFLTELATSPTNSALIFDDPVTSLDHNLRRKFAERLIDEAHKRQVIVFTHDMVFLLYLQEGAEKNKIPLTSSHLLRMKDGAGFCINGVPWVAMNIRARIGYLKNRLQKVKGVFENHGYASYEPDSRQLYGLLREAWERAIEEILLNQVVVRFGRSIQTQRLKVVKDITEEDLRFVDSSMGKCSKYFVGHDEAGAINEPVPEPDELKSDIEELENWVIKIRKRRN